MTRQGRPGRPQRRRAGSLPLLALCLLFTAGLAEPRTDVTAARAEPRAPASAASAEPVDRAADGGRAYVSDGRPARLEQAASHECARCHAAIAEEWAETTHALAWIDPHYRAELKDKRRPESCHGCHIPTPLHVISAGAAPAPKPAPRAESREPLHFAISCRSCHEGPDGSILGPWGAPTDAHASRQHPSFVGSGSNALCSSCHGTNIGPVIGVAKDFESGAAASRGLSCVGCHMAEVERPAAVEDGRASGSRAGRSHRLNGPRDASFVRQAFGFSARRASQGTAVLVTVANQAGHRLPGLLTRRFEIRAELQDERGDARASGALAIDAQAFLPADDVREIRLEGAGSRVRVRLLHVAPGVAEPVVAADELLPVAH